MKFYYNSTQWNEKKELSARRVAEVRVYLVSNSLSRETTIGELHDLLKDFECADGYRLLIHHLEPIFIYLARNGYLWPDEEQVGDADTAAMTAVNIKI